MDLGRLRRTFPSLVVVALVTGLAPRQAVAGTTRCVNSGGAGGCFSSIQAAVDASSSRDTVAVQPGTYAESVTVPARKGKLAITGAAADTTIVDASGLYVGIDIQGPGNDVALSGLTVRGATYAGIHGDRRARLGVVEMIVTQNGTGIVFDGGKATVARTTVADNLGLGIASLAHLRVDASTLRGNGPASMFGGGVSVYRRCEITNSTFVGNLAGVRVQSYSTALISSSTFSGNDVGVLLELNNPKARIRESILAGNTSADCVTQLNAKLYVAGTSLIGNPTCSYATAASATVLTGDPLLGPLADNGGPTRTQALQPGSPALGVVTRPGACGVDQRGEPRSVPCDLGAFEAP